MSLDDEHFPKSDESRSHLNRHVTLSPNVQPTYSGEPIFSDEMAIYICEETDQSILPEGTLRRLERMNYIKEASIFYRVFHSMVKTYVPTFLGKKLLNKFYRTPDSDVLDDTYARKKTEEDNE